MSARVLLERRVTLAATPRSAGQARRFVRDLLEAAGRPEWTDAATLAVSELVTNAVLHARSEVELVGRVRADHVRIEVRDGSPALPAQRSYHDQATTGRGLDLVAAVATAQGVDSLGAEGKVVWCAVGEGEAHADERSDWQVAGPTAAPGLTAVPSGELTTVVLESLPPTLWLAAQEHHDALLRELDLLHAGSGQDRNRGLDAAQSARALVEAAVAAELDHARRSGTATVPLPEAHPGTLPSVPRTVDLRLAVLPEQAEACAALQDVLDEGERLAAAGRLLLRPGLPEIVAVRDWVCEQVIAQLGGSPAAPWPGSDDDRFLEAEVDHEAGPAGWDGSRVRDSSVGVIAVDDANRVVALSEPLARLLGWSVADLVGRRVVAIVPPRFREAHVAGFSRHLSTGQSRALGVHLDLPVLRADGTELDCRFLIDAERLPGGRVVYSAEITPLPT